MRLKQVIHVETLIDGTWTEQILLCFQVHEVPVQLCVVLPLDWSDLTRGEKVVWARQQIDEHLLENDYRPVGDVIWPDMAISEDAVDDFRQLPGWAAWTGQEASQWIEDNVTTFAEAKSVLKLMAKAIVYLRDMILER